MSSTAFGSDGMLKWILSGIFLLLAILFIIGYVLVNQQVGDPTQIYTIRIKPNETAVDLRVDLEAAGLNIQPLAYSLLMRVTGADKHLQPGRYKLSGALTQMELVGVFDKGEVELSRVTIPEGLPWWRVVPILANGIPSDSGKLADLITDSDFAQKLGVPGLNLEGYLYPETYTLFAEQAPAEVLQLLVQTCQKVLNADSARIAQLKMTEYQVVILASMIEAEATAADDRPLISSVFHNRLRKGMLLQCDPTVIYALGGLDRPLYRKDLEFESLYNTYLHPGLPPGPICSPGKAAIQAALYPADTDYLYFVADGHGGHIFSRTLREHNNARMQVKQGVGRHSP